MSIERKFVANEKKIEVKNRVARNIDKPFVIEFRRQTILSASNRNAKVKQYQYICRPFEERFPCNWCGFQVVLVGFFYSLVPIWNKSLEHNLIRFPNARFTKLWILNWCECDWHTSELFETDEKRQTERMEHKFMFYDYFMIFMDRILCDRNLFIFFLLFLGFWLLFWL